MEVWSAASILYSLSSLFVQFFLRFKRFALKFVQMSFHLPSRASRVCLWKAPQSRDCESRNAITSAGGAGFRFAAAFASSRAFAAARAFGVLERARAFARVFGFRNFARVFSRARALRRRLEESCFNLFSERLCPSSTRRRSSARAAGEHPPGFPGPYC